MGIITTEIDNNPTLNLLEKFGGIYQIFDTKKINSEKAILKKPNKSTYCDNKKFSPIFPLQIFSGW